MPERRNNNMVQIRLPTPMKERWEREAAKRGMPLAEFLRALTEAYLDFEDRLPRRREEE